MPDVHKEDFGGAFIKDIVESETFDGIVKNVVIIHCTLIVLGGIVIDSVVMNILKQEVS